MNFREKISFLAFIILVTSIWLTFGERIEKGSGWTVAVVTGTGVEKQVRRFRNVRNYREYQNHLEALADLEDGKADVVIMDYLSALNRIKQLGESDLKLAGERLTNTKGRVVFKAEDDALRLLFDQALLELIEDGTYQRLSMDYFGAITLKNGTKALKDSQTEIGDGSWLRIRDKGVIKFGLILNNPPFSYYNSENRLTGFDVELAKAICQELKLECHLVDMDWYGTTEGLEVSYDALWIGANDWEPMGTQVKFSEPYYYSGAQLVVKTDSPIIGPKFLNQGLPSFESLFKRRIFN